MGSNSSSSNRLAKSLRIDRTLTQINQWERFAMRFVISLLTIIITVSFIISPAHAKQYLNRRLLECDPLSYVVEPLEITGGTLHLSSSWSNDYGDCTGLAPGPPFIIEMPVTIRNERNPDGSVLEWGNLIISNQYAAAGPMEIVVLKGAGLICYGPVEAHGGIGTPVIFTGNGPTTFSHYTPPADTAEYERNFTYCNFRPGPYSHDPACDISGGHVRLENCTFGPTDGQYGLFLGSGGNDVVLKDCVFDRTSMRTWTTPNSINGAGTLYIDGLRFNNCQVGYPAQVTVGCLFISFMSYEGPRLKNLTNISGSNNSHDWIVFYDSEFWIKDSCTIQTTSDFPALFTGVIKVDTNAVLSIEDGSVLHMNTNGRIQQYANSKIVMDNAIITAAADKNANGIYLPGYSTDIPWDARAWEGVEMEPGSRLEMKNNSVIRWASGPVEGTGNITVDHSRIEQSWGSMINLRPTSPCSLNVIASTIGPVYSTGRGIRFVMSTDPTDSAAGYINIDSTTITKCGGEGIYIGGGEGRSLDIDYNVRITNSVISGNGDNGLWGQMGPPADSIVIMNNTFIGNGGVGCYLNSGDSMSVRMENNIALGNGGAGLGVHTGFADIIGNSSLYNSGTGISYVQRPARLGYVANNIMAYNDGRGLYCNAKYGGVVPTFAHNIVWSNNGTDDDLLYTSDDFEVYTMAELHALGGVGLTNDAFSPELQPISKASVSSQRYFAATNETGVYVGGTALLAGQLDGLAVLPTQRDTTYWCYVMRNTEDSVYIAGDIRSEVNNGDTMTFYDFHLNHTSPAIGFGDTDYVSTEYDIDGDERIIDADSNGTALVDAGGDEYNPDSTFSLFFVGSPKNDTTLVPGESVYIAWVAPGVDSVNIDYTFDIPLGGDPSTWLQITHGYPTALPLCLWEIPAIQSSRCRIRVSDAANPSHYAYSGIFHIKQVRLTRFAADSTYEFYQPSLHGWSYTNDSSFLWPFAVWQGINYETGTDPYTGRLYPYDDPAYRFGDNEDEYYPSWPLWVETFGTDQCYNSTPAGMMYVLRSLYKWSSCCDTWGGSCSGLATSALLVFGNSNLLEPRWGHLNLPATINTASITDDIREYINVMHTAQFGRVQEEFFDNGYSIPIDTTIRKIREHLLNTVRDDACVTIGSQNKEEAHTVLPYAMVPDTDPSKIRVMVYDPNEPGNDNLFILADTSADTWLYSEFPGWQGAHNFYLDYPIRSIIDSPELKAVSGVSEPGGTHVIIDSLIQFMYSRSADMTLFTIEGDSIGFNDSGLFNSIGDGEPLIPFDVHPARPYGFLLPNLEYHGTLGNCKDSIARAECYYDSLYLGYRRQDADSTQTDYVHFSGTGLTVANPDAVPKLVHLSVINTMSDRERAVVALGYGVGADDTVVVEPMGDSGWYLANRGGTSQYNLWFREVTSSGETVFSVEDVSIESGQGHMILPDWTGLTSDSCWLYLDTDSNKVVDDSTLLVGDLLVDVEEEEHGAVLPCTFELSQNYPNPFNPTTTIEYSLPRQAHVSIDVYNILGRKVRTLVDRVEAAGSYTLTWDGASADGQRVATGVYFYRFQAGEYVTTKKMLLLK